MTAANAQSKAEAVHAELEAGIAALVTSEDWTRALATAAKFHRYSFGNQVLIVSQRPSASRVAGFKRWQEMGRYVRKGEKGIAILAPMVSRREVEDPQTGDTTTVRFLRGFRVVHVFDISQTDGAELVEVRPSVLESDGPQGLWEALSDFAVSLGYSVEREALPRAYGYCEHETRRIVVREGVSRAQACKTLAHEIAHALLHPDLDEYARNRGRFEVEAESVAFVVLGACGVEADGYSFPYVARWANGDAKLVSETGARVVECASRILTALEAESSETRETVGAVA